MKDQAIQLLMGATIAKMDADYQQRLNKGVNSALRWAGGLFLLTVKVWLTLKVL